jgi:hypothetical protein
MSADGIELRDGQTGALLDDDTATLGSLNPGAVLALRANRLNQATRWLDIYSSTGIRLSPDLAHVHALRLLRSNEDGHIVVYVVERGVSSGYKRPTAVGTTAGVEGLFSLANAWRPAVLLQNGIDGQHGIDSVEHTDRGMSCMLSCLYVLSHALLRREDRRTRLLARLRSLLHDFPPVINALKVPTHSRGV